MKMIYAALLLHSLGKEINEHGIKNVMEAAGAEVDHAQLKALVANLKGVNIEEAIKNASLVQAAPAASEKLAGEKAEENKEEKAEEKAEEAAAGLSALFG
jgi:large subunit ribosomal protein L12